MNRLIFTWRRHGLLRNLSAEKGRKTHPHPGPLPEGKGVILNWEMEYNSAFLGPPLFFAPDIDFKDPTRLLQIQEFVAAVFAPGGHVFFDPLII